MERVFPNLRQNSKHIEKGIEKGIEIPQATRHAPPAHLSNSAVNGKKRRNKRDSMISFISSFSSSDEKVREGGKQGEIAQVERNAIARGNGNEVEMWRDMETALLPAEAELRVAMAVALPVPISEREAEAEDEAETEGSRESHSTTNVLMGGMPPSLATSRSTLYQQPTVQTSTSSFESTASTLLEQEPNSPLPLLSSHNQDLITRHRLEGYGSLVSRVPHQDCLFVLETMVEPRSRTFALQQRLQEQDQRVTKAEERRRRQSLAWPQDPWRGGFGPPSTITRTEFVGYGNSGMASANSRYEPSPGAHCAPLMNGRGHRTSRGTGGGETKSTHSMGIMRSIAGNGDGEGAGEGVGALRGMKDWMRRRSSVGKRGR